MESNRPIYSTFREIKEALDNIINISDADFGDRASAALVAIKGLPKEEQILALEYLIKYFDCGERRTRSLYRDPIKGSHIEELYKKFPPKKLTPFFSSLYHNISENEAANALFSILFDPNETGEEKTEEEQTYILEILLMSKIFPYRQLSEEYFTEVYTHDIRKNREGIKEEISFAKSIAFRKNLTEQPSMLFHLICKQRTLEEQFAIFAAILETMNGEAEMPYKD